MIWAFSKNLSGAAESTDKHSHSDMLALTHMDAHRDMILYIHTETHAGPSYRDMRRYARTLTNTHTYFFTPLTFILSPQALSCHAGMGRLGTGFPFVFLH